ncbi:MAG: PSD1 and planctomycete cytochrome C domain-containing protein [Akkermansiaceae bacterium]
MDGRLALTLLALAAALPAQAGEFNRDIRPILSDKCFHCHGPDPETREEDLRLDTFEGATKDGAILPGRPDESEFMKRILHSDPDEVMPPPESHKKVTKKEAELLRKWIANGAKYEEPWTYQQPVKVATPKVKNVEWPSKWVDHFILNRLEKENLTPSPDADAVTLVRRLHFDLVGLPPTPKRVQSFKAAAATSLQAAVDAEVDFLLKSPHFGERLAIYWLDLVRYADTVGYHGDQPHNISPYRDYVIDSFNRNIPFDQFTREQLAGDLLAKPTQHQIIATGYNRLLQTTHEGGLQPAEYRAIYQADRVRNVSAVWMGATVGCAQCHDHKYDPYSAKDHYQMAAFFADIDDEAHFKSGTNSLPTKREPEIRVFTADQEKAIKHLKQKISDIVGNKRKKIDAISSQVNTLAQQHRRERNVDKKKKLQAKLMAKRSELAALLPGDHLAKWKKLTAEHKKIESAGRLTMITKALPEPREVRVLPRGNWMDNTGEVVQASVPHFLPQIEKNGRANRLDLAHWLTDSKNGTGGLTARVMANRFFYLYFGTGISRSLSDFGGQGQPPSNPELLDRLAIEFYESGWDIKHMVRLLTTSRAYRQSSLTPSNLRELDPYNQLVARQSRFRLPAELIRDNALDVSGLLVKTTGGASVKPSQPAGYYRHLNFPVRKYKQDTGEEAYRRSLYIHWQRQFLHPMLKAFDAPSREECTAERPRSNTPVAAINLLNDPSFVEAARALAERVLREAAKDDRGRLNRLYEVVLGREPSDVERKAMTELYSYASKDFKQRPDAAKKLIGIGQTPADATHDPVLLASWTTVCRAMLNLSETTTRN